LSESWMRENRPSSLKSGEWRRSITPPRHSSTLLMDLRRAGPSLWPGVWFLHGPAPHAFRRGRASHNGGGRPRREAQKQRGAVPARSAAERGEGHDRLEGGRREEPGEPGGPLASGASGGAAPHPGDTGERAERLPRSGNGGRPARGAVGPISWGSGIGPGFPPEGATAASPAERECRRFGKAFMKPAKLSQILYITIAG